jgi:hypothetical protein
MTEELPWVIDQLLEACGGSGEIADIKSLAILGFEIWAARVARHQGIGDCAWSRGRLISARCINWLFANLTSCLVQAKGWVGSINVDRNKLIKLN